MAGFAPFFSSIFYILLKEENDGKIKLASKENDIRSITFYINICE